MNAHTAPKRTTDRAIRVFVSSTFRDMHAEREELVKRVFPRLRKLCESRGVTWGEVDLRWGVTDEQKAEGEVLPICLAEIDRCRPYFIGLLGERYGWVPREIPAALIEREGWLAEHRGCSVTELEILHGVLGNPAMADHAFFYLRSPSYLETLPEPERSDYRERPSPEEIERFGREEAETRTEERRAKLAALKDRIRASGFPVRDGYPDPETLGKRVLADLTGVIDRLFPEGTQPDPPDREAGEHEAFARSRAGVYIGRDEYFERLDAHVRSDGPPLVVLGESGSGKSALLANWAFRYRERSAGAAGLDDEVLLLHFIGASPASADWAAMVRRILGEFRRWMDVEVEIPDAPEELRATLANALHMAAAKGRVVLVLDALNQLEDRDQAPDLPWLPPVIPENVRLIVSTLPGRPLDELTRRGWPTLEVEPLEPEERKVLTVRYLAQYRKKLSGPRIERIVRAPQTANPLFLRALLEELRLWGEHETLKERIEHYLSAATVDQLYERILARYEEDYERDRPGLVRDAMSLIWAVRRGLTEAELLDMMGRDGEPLSAAHWSPLYLAAEHALVSRSGFIGFFHDYLRQAVQHRYLPGQAEQKTIHLRLADYFEARELGHRKVDELPWQLAEAEAWDRLAGLLADLPFFERAWDIDQFEVKAYWARVEASSDHRLLDAYRSVLADPRHYRSWVWRLGILFMDTGHQQEAAAVWHHISEKARALGDAAKLSKSVGNEAIVMWGRGELDQALALLQDQERLCASLGDHAGLSRALNNQALVHYDRGDLDTAMHLHRRQERICRQMGNKIELSKSLGNQALILKNWGELDDAMSLHKEEERLCRQIGNRTGLSGSLGNQALILRRRGKLTDAMKLLKEQERLCREVGDKLGLPDALGNQALILRDWGELAEAMARHKEAEQLCREVGNKKKLSISIGNQAVILWDEGELEEAMSLHREEERLCRELGDRAGLSASLGNQALILRDLGRLSEAMTLLKEEEKICRELGDRAGLQVSLGNQALILRARGELDAAMALHKEEQRICRELHLPEGLAISLVNEAVILSHSLEQPRAALPLAEEAYRLASENGLTSLASQVGGMLHDNRARA